MSEDTPSTRFAAERCRLSIIIPVFNEAENLGAVLDRIHALAFPGAEVIVVDDGSTDGSAEVAATKGATVIRHPYNIGNGAAVKSGIRAARGRLLAFMDGDGQHQPEDIDRLLAEARKYHMVVGARGKGSKLRFHRYLANLVYNLFASYVAQFRVEDLTSGFRVLARKDALRFIDLLPNTFSYPSTLTLAFLRSGLTVKYVPIQTLYRSGESKIRLVADGVRFLLIITKIATLFSPFRVFLPVSLFFLFTGIGYYLYTYVTEGRFTNMTVFLLTTAVIIFMMGLVSEQVALLRTERRAAFLADDPDRETWVVARGHVSILMRRQSRTCLAMSPDQTTRLSPELTAIRRFYDELYHKKAGGSGGVSTHLRRLARRLGIQPGDCLLDVGCGTREWLLAGAAEGAVPVGIDFSRTAIEICRRKLPQAELHCCAAETLPFDSRRFDIVTCLGCLEQFLEPEGNDPGFPARREVSVPGTERGFSHVPPGTVPGNRADPDQRGDSYARRLGRAF